jgi:hypothetical protein
MDVVLHLQMSKPDPGALGKRPVSGVLAWLCSEVSVEFFGFVPEPTLVGDLWCLPPEYHPTETGGLDVPDGVE